MWNIFIQFHTRYIFWIILEQLFMEDKEFTITGAGLLDSFTTPKVKHIGVSVSNNANL